MKTYSTKANANRAAKSQGLNPAAYAVYKQGDVWAIEIQNEMPMEAWEIEAQQEAQNVKHLAETKAKLDAELKAQWLAAFVPYNAMLLLPAPKVEAKAKKVVDYSKESKVDNPVKLVWHIADEMWGERRTDIINACVAAGIAYNTARTQYQAFYKVKKSQEEN